MRFALAIAFVLSSGATATAQVAQDRYGPPRAAALAAGSQAFLTASLGRPYGGPMLRWASKRAPEAGAAEAAQPAPAPAPPMAVASLPDNDYAARSTRFAPPLASSPAMAPAAPIAAEQPQRSQPAQPIRHATAPSARTAGAPPRFYSLHREYGLAPDSVPEQSPHPRYVLIGPPDEPTGKDAAGKPPADRDDDPST